MRTTKKKVNNDRQEIVEELDKLLDNNDNDAQNIEAIEELQSELNNIDAQKERDYPYPYPLNVAGTSWNKKKVAENLLNSEPDTITLPS